MISIEHGIFIRISTPPRAPFARPDQALDSAFGAGTRQHVLSAISTTLEAVLFEVVASKSPREFPDALHHGILYSIFLMIAFTWAVVVLELANPLGREHEHEREFGPPRSLSLPPSPRLLMLGRFSPANTFSRPGTGSGRTPTTIHVQPSASLVIPGGTECTGSIDSERIEDGRQKPSRGRGGKGAAVVVPIEEQERKYCRKPRVCLVDV